MKVALIYGFFSSQTRGPYDVANIENQDLTGSESFFFSMARGLSARGHEIDAYGFWNREETLNGIHYIPFVNFQEGSNARASTFELRGVPTQYQAAISWNEPDYLCEFPATVKRVCIQQLNDFYYCHRPYQESTDLYLFPSKIHMEHVLKVTPGLPADKCGVFSNCINNEHNLKQEAVRNPMKMVYCSSPDRGLHWALEIFSKVRLLEPNVQLHVFYRYKEWYERLKNASDPGVRDYYEMGMRARYCNAVFDRLGRDGENGLFLRGPTPSKQMAKELLESRILLYPCDTVSFTEGFGVSVLDACAAGTLPIISDVDAFGEVYSGVAHVIPGRPDWDRRAWEVSVFKGLRDDVFFESVTARCKEFAKQYTAAVKVEKLENFLNEITKVSA